MRPECFLVCFFHLAWNWGTSGTTGSSYRSPRSRSYVHDNRGCFATARRYRYYRRCERYTIRYIQIFRCRRAACQYNWQCRPSHAHTNRNRCISARRKVSDQGWYTNYHFLKSKFDILIIDILIFKWCLYGVLSVWNEFSTQVDRLNTIVYMQVFCARFMFSVCLRFLNTPRKKNFPVSLRIMKFSKNWSFLECKISQYYFIDYLGLALRWNVIQFWF